MNYIIKIDDKNPKAKNIINLLNQLAEDYSFMSIMTDKNELPENIVKELESRYKYVTEHPEDGKSWEEIKEKLLKK